MESQQNRSSHEIEVVVEKIRLAKRAYYEGSTLFYNDDEYDALENRLRELCPSHPILESVGSETTKQNQKISHSVPMLSLLKTYSALDIANFSLDCDTVCVDKVDGMALKLVYSSEGNFLLSATRGNGKIGENVSAKVKIIKCIPQKLNDFFSKMMSNTILKSKMKARNENEKGGILFEVRGEIYFPMSVFDERFSGQFESYRNAVAGTFGRKEIEEARNVLQELRFFAYDCFFQVDGVPVEIFETHWQKLLFLEELGFDSGIKSGHALLLSAGRTENQILCTEAEWQAFLESSLAKDRNFLVDGLVFRKNSEIEWRELGNTAHHPRGSVAFKLQGETAATKLLAIETSLGRSGKLTFRAKLEPVELSGAKISYATLHNIDFILDGKYSPGATVLLKRSGEVIPAIVSLVSAGEETYQMPTSCPCGFPLTKVGPNLFCLNEQDCPPKNQENLLHFVTALDIKGVSEKLVLKLREAGLLSSLVDFYKLTISDIELLPGLGKKSAENIYKAIAEKKSLSLSDFLLSLSLSRGGEVKCIEVAEHFRSLEALQKASWEDFLKLPGWAEKSAKDFVFSLSKKEREIKELLEFVKIKPLEEKLVQTDHKLFGKTMCITGKLNFPREQYEEKIKSVGGKVTSKVTSKTDFLVCNEESGSTKYADAVRLGKKIYSEIEFNSEFFPGLSFL